jgi:hypothetical protein
MEFFLERDADRAVEAPSSAGVDGVLDSIAGKSAIIGGDGGEGGR